MVARLGEQRAREGAYVWQKLIKSGATIANGTDAPVEDVDPIANFYASVSRRLADGSVFFPDQRMTRSRRCGPTRETARTPRSRKPTAGP